MCIIPFNFFPLFTYREKKNILIRILKVNRDKHTKASYELQTEYQRALQIPSLTFLDLEGRKRKKIIRNPFWNPLYNSATEPSLKSHC